MHSPTRKMGPFSFWRLISYPKLNPVGCWDGWLPLRDVTLRCAFKLVCQVDVCVGDGADDSG